MPSALGLSHRIPLPLSRVVSVLQNASVGPEPMEAMQMEKEKIALVVRVVRKDCKIPVGIIRMKDLVEELFGELSSR